MTGDQQELRWLLGNWRFNSRPSCDGRLGAGGHALSHCFVSIHARRVTGDTNARNAWTRRCFNSRPSCDGRHRYCPPADGPRCFNSRPSCDGRPDGHHPVYARRCFNSRPSCDGRHEVMFVRIEPSSFNSRPSCDGRRFSPAKSLAPLSVSIHARRVTGDSCGASCGHCSSCFNSRPSCDGRQSLGDNGRDHRGFNSRPSCDGRQGLPGRRAGGGVSIHARRVTGDTLPGERLLDNIVSIHARRVTGDV